jgi:MFS transporter, UMF1 family
MSETPASDPSPVAGFPPVKRREIFGWCCFDFANSSFTTIIITVVYARYFMGVVAADLPSAPALWGGALALAQLFVILVSPLIGAMADARAGKKLYLMCTAVTCSISTAALFFVGPGEVWLALTLVSVANIAFLLSENLCAAFLPEISTQENVGRISGYGWSFGYFGGLLCLALALVIIKSGPGRVPWTFAMTGGFFLLASLPTLLLLRERAVPQPLRPGETYFSVGWRANVALLRELPQHRTLWIFFIAMAIYVAGLTAVVAFAGVFAGTVLGMTEDQVILLFVVLQLAGVVGAYGFGLVQDRVGSKAALVSSLVLWVIVCTWAGFCRSQREFYAIGMLAGIALGSLQSAGRAVVSTLTPPGRSGEFFGCWGFFGKLGGVIGQPLFGLLAAWLGYRAAIIANGGFFLIGLLILLGLNLRPRAVNGPAA